MELVIVKCEKCGADRPDEEIKNKSCANCQDIESRKNFAANSEKLAEEQKKMEEEAKEKYKSLPDLDKLNTWLYDNEVGVYWFGINLKHKDCEPITLMLEIDKAKLGLLQVFADWKMKQTKKDSLLIKSKESVGGMMDRLSKAGKAVSNLLIAK